jgi:hypothetical protein
MRAEQSTVLRKERDGLDGLGVIFCAVQTLVSQGGRDVGNYGTSEGKRWHPRTGAAGVQLARGQDCS